MNTSGRKTIRATAATSAPKSVKAAKADKLSSSSVIPSKEEIAKRSYELYLARGAAAGHEEEDWLRAEAELLGKSV
jgi:hypothetical protein